MAFRFSKEKIAELEKVALRYCDNCGRKHWGSYVVYHHWEYGDDLDWAWTDRQGNEKLCAKGHRRDACSPKECNQCSYDAWEADKKLANTTKSEV